MEPAKMLCVTYPMYHPYSGISSAWIRLVINEVSSQILMEFCVVCFNTKK